MQKYPVVIDNILELFKLNSIVNGNNNIIVTSLIMAFLTFISNFIANNSFKYIDINLFIDNIKVILLNIIQ